MRTITLYGMLSPLLFCLCQPVCLADMLQSDGTKQPRIDHDVSVPMRDGTLLRADVYRPEAQGKYPVIVSRTPYGKSADGGMGIQAASHGYIYVSGDCRGRFKSAGSWDPYRYEANDGYDTVEWAAKLSESDGRVFLRGGSYAGVTALAAAAAAPPHLVAVDIIESGANYYNGWTYEGGVLRQLFVESWTSVLAFNSIPDKTGRFLELGHTWVYDLNKPIDQYPIAITANHTTAPFYRDFLRHASLDSYWENFAIDASKIRVPLLIFGGWYDLFTSNTVNTFHDFQQKDPGAESRLHSQLMIGPWTHGGFTARQGDYDFGSTAARDVVAYIFEWIDANAKQPNDPQKQTRVSYFEMGTNVWRTTTAWPPNDVSSVTMALSSGGHANSAQGDGILLLDSKAEASGSDSFTYDPKNPVQTAGGGLCCGVVAPGAFDQSKAEARSDVLVYSSEPLKSDLNLTGNLTVRLFVKTSAKDTDFTAKLVDVMLDGSTRNVADNILRLRYRKSLQRPAFLKPGDLAEIEIPIGPTSNVFLTGHRVRLEVSSSNFPRFARNLNTRKDGYHTTASVPAVNTVVHDATHPSSLIVTGGATTSR
jgi:uncharacterized protein